MLILKIPDLQNGLTHHINGIKVLLIDDEITIADLKKLQLLVVK